MQQKRCAKVGNGRWLGGIIVPNGLAGETNRMWCTGSEVVNIHQAGVACGDGVTVQAGAGSAQVGKTPACSNVRQRSVVIEYVQVFQ